MFTNQPFAVYLKGIVEPGWGFSEDRNSKSCTVQSSYRGSPGWEQVARVPHGKECWNYWPIDSISRLWHRSSSPKDTVELPNNSGEGTLLVLVLLKSFQTLLVHSLEYLG